MNNESLNNQWNEDFNWISSLFTHVWVGWVVRRSNLTKVLRGFPLSFSVCCVAKPNSCCIPYWSRSPPDAIRFRHSATPPPPNTYHSPFAHLLPPATHPQQSAPPNTYLSPFAHLLPPATHPQQSAYQHLTIFNYRSSTLPPAYLYQKDERAQPDNLQSCEILITNRAPRFVSLSVFLSFPMPCILKRSQREPQNFQSRLQFFDEPQNLYCLLLFHNASAAHLAPLFRFVA